MNEQFKYVGEELALFAQAVNWKAYLRDQIVPHLRGDVLEVGAGIGETTRVLHHAGVSSWTCLEPDGGQAGLLRASFGERPLAGADPAVVVGTIDCLPLAEAFDTIIYIDVLEHIEDDRGQLEAAASRLRPRGQAVILSPAHAWLYSAFDQAIGHLRRYNRSSLNAAVPKQLKTVLVRYLDSMGLLASLGNRMVLRSPLPSPRQLRTWDRLLVRTSRTLDPLWGYRIGKSILMVVEK